MQKQAQLDAFKSDILFFRCFRSSTFVSMTARRIIPYTSARTQSISLLISSRLISATPFSLACARKALNACIAPSLVISVSEDEYNDTYGRSGMRDALLQKKPKDVDIPSERTVYRVMEEIGISHRPKRKPNGITKADKAARKSDDLLKRDFRSTEPLTKCVTDITEIKASDGKLYVSAIFDCFDLAVLGLAMATNMKAPLCARTLRNAHKAYPGIEGAICHSDRGVQYTSDCYRRAVQDCHITQSMNSDGGRCHDNARCESMWARMKSELLYDRYDTEKMTVTELKELIWRYYMSYWNNRRICSANDGCSGQAFL